LSGPGQPAPVSEQRRGLTKLAAYGDSDRHWRRWGEIDPYFAVLADPRFRREKLADSREDFFQSGQLYVEERLNRARALFGDFPQARALDFGCGVGRLSLPLAAHFGEVVGLDVAPAMLDEARVNAEARDVGNLRLALADDLLSACAGPFDFVMSCMVLQHVPPRRGLPLVARLLDRVGPGGVAALHFCIGQEGGAGARLRAWAQSHVPGVHGLFNRLRGRPADEPLMQMNAYPLDRLLAIAADRDFGSVMVDFYVADRFDFAQLLMRRS
jgi:SAM-dependent methyltransferase